MGNSKAAKSRLSFEAFPFVPGSTGFVQVHHPLKKQTKNPTTNKKKPTTKKKIIKMLQVLT